MYSFLHSGQENPSFPVQNIKKVALIPVVPWQLSLKRIDIQNIPFYILFMNKRSLTEARPWQKPWSSFFILQSRTAKANTNATLFQNGCLQSTLADLSPGPFECKTTAYP